MGGIVSGGSVKDHPSVPTHAWEDDGTHAPMRIIPDTGGNFLSFPVHLLAVGALWFVGTPQTQIIWHRLLRAEEVHQGQQHGSEASALHFTGMLFLVLLSAMIFFMRYTHYHLLFWSDSKNNPTWWTPEMSVDFSQGAPMPPIEVVLSVISELTCIATFAASGTIFATMYLRTDATKVRFMQLLEDHVTLNHHHLVAGAIVEGGTGSQRSPLFDTISAPFEMGGSPQLHVRGPAFAGTPRQPSTGIDDIVSSGTLTRMGTTIKSEELKEGVCLLATVLEEHFLRVVRAVSTMETLLNRVLSYFAVCLLAAGVCTTYVYNISWDRQIFPYHEYRVTLLLLLLPEIILPVYCVLVGARANSLDKFKRAICDADARGAFAHLDMSERANLLLRMTATHMPQIAAFGVPITPRNVYTSVAIAGVMNTAFAHR